MYKNFICLGSTDSETTRLDQKIILKISVASAAYGKLQERLWRIELSPPEVNVRYAELLCLAHSFMVRRLGPFTSHK